MDDGKGEAKIAVVEYIHCEIHWAQLVETFINERNIYIAQISNTLT